MSIIQTGWKGGGFDKPSEMIVLIHLGFVHKATFYCIWNEEQRN
jgi:hypothetical protein